jgi:hypothetical protein
VKKEEEEEEEEEAFGKSARPPREAKGGVRDLRGGCSKDRPVPPTPQL